jgi:microcystin-dependent protein
MDSPFLGSIVPMAFTFAPRGWMSCEGQILSIAQYSALFSLLGTNYGGNGTSTFGLPDLRGRVIKGQGTGPGLATYITGQKGGTESVSIAINNMPAHSHVVTVTTNGLSGNLNDPSNNYFGAANIYETSQDGTKMNAGAVTAGNTGNNIPVGILTPYLAMYYNIATQGIFPSRN